MKTVQTSHSRRELSEGRRLLFFHGARLLLLAFLFGAFSPALASEGLNACDFGATGDESANDSPAIQRALDAAAATGGEVFLPAGRYRLEEGLRIPSGVTLAGAWQAPHHSELKKGTTLLAYAGKGSEDGPALIHLLPNSTIRGVTIFYPEQRLPGIVPYPWTIQGEGNHCNVLDVTLVNPYRGIDFGEFPNELHHIRNVFGTPLKAGIHIDKCTDIGRIENVHFNPHYWGFWGIPGDEYRPDWHDLLNYLYENCVAFSFARTDWEYVLNTFSFGCKVGYRFYESEAGSTNGNFLGIGADYAKTAVLVEQTQPPGLLITNGEFVGGTGAETVVDIIDGHSGVVQFANSSFWGPHKKIVRADGRGFVSFNQCNFQNWDVRNEDLPAIHIRGGEVNISNSFFRQNKRQIVLEENVETAVISGNRFLGAERIVNRARGDVQTGLNVVAHREFAITGDPLPVSFSEWRFRADRNANGEDLGWQRDETDDGWRPIEVPGSWHDALPSPYYGYAWYRTKFALPAEVAARGVRLHFEGVDEQAWVYVNGEKAGEHTVESARRPVAELWDRPFTIDIPPALLRPGEENVLAVRVHASTGQAGIWRPLRIHPQK